MLQDRDKSGGYYGNYHFNTMDPDQQENIDFSREDYFESEDEEKDEGDDDGMMGG